MAIIVDPDNLDRFSTIWNTDSENISTYPVGGAQRFASGGPHTIHDAWVDSTGSIRRAEVPSSDYAFDGAADVDATTDQITLNAVDVSHSLQTGDRLIYDENAQTPFGNLVDNDIVFVRRVDAADIKIYTTSAAAYADGTAIDMNEVAGERFFEFFKDWNADGAVVVGDVVCILTGVEAGHYYVQAEVTDTLTLADIDDGTAGAATTNLDATTANFLFDGITAVNTGTDVITIGAHTYNTGDSVVYFDSDLALEPAPLISGSRYYVIRTSGTEIQLAFTLVDANAGTQINITATGTTGDHEINTALTIAVFTNGANTNETLGGLSTAGDGTGIIADGVTLQTYYSSGKEEWRLDSIQNGDEVTWDPLDYSDDLIRHEFPFEAITSEQFEVGGGTSHTDWTWFNAYSEKKVRTGGWAEKNTATTTLFEFTGIVTLGSLDTDTQVYYQNAAGANPINFTFLGVVNEPILTFTDGGDDDTGFLKLFARKKARSYAGSEISDIGVTTIQTIVNRFPLAHIPDAAIVANDGDILGIAPFRDGHDVTGIDAIDGAKTINLFVFDDADATFQTDGIVNGDTLQIAAGVDAGFYSIQTVSAETELTILQDTEFTSTGWASTESSLTYSIFSFFRVADKTTTPGTVADYTTAGGSEGIIETATPGIGTITDTTGAHFLGAGAGNDAVVRGDVLFLVGTAAGNDGLYKVLDGTDPSPAANPSTTIIFVDTSDQAFPASLEGAIDYKVFTDGMYLQFKDISISETPPTNGYAFDADDAGFGNRPTILRIAGGTPGTWDAGIGPGTMIDLSNAEDTANNGRYTVHTRESDTVLSLIEPAVNPDVLTPNTADTTVVVAPAFGFERSIGSDAGGSVFAFRWRLFGNGSTLANNFQFVQHQLRQTSDIDFGAGTNRGDITDLLMSFASPTGTGLDMIIDNLDANDINNATFNDHSGLARNFPFTAAGNLSFNANLVSDSGPAKYWLFFLDDNAPGDNLGRDYGTTEAIIVEDATTPTAQTIEGNVTGSTIAFTYAYDTNIQRGASTAATDAPVVLVAIGLATAQFVIANATITRSVGQTITAVAALERNYSNP